jgi:hypothetical protein
MNWPTVLLTASILLPGCTHRVFDESTREDYGLDLPQAHPRLKQVQFFTSERIVLRHERETKNDKLRVGRIVHRRNQTVRELVIPAGTPGISVAADERTITVAFSRDAKIVFERREEPGIEDSEATEYYGIRHQTREDGTRVLTVDGRSYQLDRRGAQARLMFAEWTVKRLRTRRRFLTGRRVHAARP